MLLPDNNLYLSSNLAFNIISAPRYGTRSNEILLRKVLAP